MNHLLLILTGGTGIPLLVFAVARRLVEGHADQAAAAIRRAHHAKARPAARTKELTPR